VITNLQVGLRGERLTDRDFVRGGRIGRTPRDDPRTIHDRTEAGIESTRDRLQILGLGKLPRAATQAREGLDTLYLTKRAKLRSRRVANEEFKIRGPARSVEPHERGFGTAGTGNS
jgi:hypothetical protein